MEGFILKIDKNLLKNNKEKYIKKISRQVVKKFTDFKIYNKQSSDNMNQRNNIPSGVNSLLPRPHDYPYKILENGKIFTKIDKNSDNMEIFNSKIVKGCNCKNCWINKNFQIKII